MQYQLDLLQPEILVRIQMFLKWHYKYIVSFPRHSAVHVLQGMSWRSSLYPSVWMAECLTWFLIVILKDMVDCYINKTKLVILRIICFLKYIQVWNINWITRNRFLIGVRSLVFA